MVLESAILLSNSSGFYESSPSTRYGFCCRNAADVYRLDKRRWGDEPAVKHKSGVVRKGALRAPLSTADVFWRDRNDDLDSNSEISREMALPSPSPPPPAEQGNP